MTNTCPVVLETDVLRVQHVHMSEVRLHVHTTAVMSERHARAFHPQHVIVRVILHCGLSTLDFSNHGWCW